MIAAPGILVNGIKITPEQINAEVQYHPASTLLDAKYQAMQALVIRELLLQRAAKAGIAGSEDPDGSIEKLLEREISVPDPGPEECERYYNNNKSRFYTAPLFEASHILYIASPQDAEARKLAREKAATSLAKLTKNPSLFAEMARAESACSSASMDGNLGQISKGQTLPAFEAALSVMKEGDLSAEPVETEVGFHIIKVHKKIDGRLMPFDMVAEWIAGHLRQQSWRRAFSQYVQILAGQAEISGFRLKGAETPLVQ